nr:MAG TPA: Nuclear pore complex protein [Caudoviricetes sp.]
MPDTLDPLNLATPPIDSEPIGGDALEAQAQQEMQEQIANEAQGVSNGVNEGAWAERALSQKRKLRSDLDEYLKLQAQATPDDSPEFLQALSERRNQLINSGIDPDYEKYRDKVDRIQGKIYAITQNINPKTGLFGVVPTEDVKDSRLGTLLTAEQIGYFNSLPKSMQDEFLFEGIVETFFPQGGMDKVTALGLLKEHYQTDSMHGVVSKYAQELQRNKDEETAYNEASTRFFDSFIETGGDYQKAIDSLEGNLNLYAENIFNQEPALKYIYQRAYNSVSWIKDEYIESGELDWDKMADRLLKLGEGETFSLAIQMLPYMLPKDDRTWLTQAIDDTASDVSRFARLMVDGGGDSAQAERLALAIQQEYRQGRDMPTSWIGRAFKAATDQVPKVAAVTGSSLLASPGGPVAMAATGTAVGSMVYGSTVGLEAYRTNSSRAGALTYGVTVGALEGLLENVTLGVGALASKGIKVAEAGRKMASVAGRVPATVRGAAAGALSEYTQEVIADPIYVGLENVMRSAGFELTQQNTLKNWWETLDFTSPELLGATAILGGSIGAVGGYQANHLINRVGRSASALQAYGVPESEAVAIAEMPDGKERTNRLISALRNNRVSPDVQITNQQAGIFLNFLAKNAERFKDVELMPEISDNGDGTFNIVERDPVSGAEKVTTVTDEIAGTFMSQALQSNPGFIRALNIFAQEEIESGVGKETKIKSYTPDELRAKIQSTEDNNATIARLRALAVINQDPELLQSFRDGKVSIEDVANELEIVSAYRDGTIAVARGEANPLNILEEIIHARAISDLESGVISRDVIETQVRNYLEFLGRSSEEIGDLSNDVLLQEHLANMGKALATTPELFSSMPGNVQTILEWQKDAIAEVGNIFEEGNLIREAIEQGVVSSDFVKWSKSLATMAERRDGQDVGELINGATGENILPMGKTLPSARRRGTIDVTPSIKTINEAIKSIVEGTSERAVGQLHKLQRSMTKLSERFSQGKLTERGQQKALLNSVLSIANAMASGSRKFISNQLADRLANPKSNEAFNADMKTALDATVRALNERAEEASRKQLERLIQDEIKRRVEQADAKAKKDFSREMKFLRSLISKEIRKDIKEERAEAAAEKKLATKSIESLRRLAENAFKDTKGRSRSLDAQAREETMDALTVMAMSPEEVAVQLETLDSTIDELQNQKASEENALELENLENQKNLLEVFGSALYRERMPNGRYKYALNAQQLAEAVKTLKELQREGRLRRKKVNEQIERFYNKFNAVINERVGGENNRDALRKAVLERDQRGTGFLDRIFTGFMSLQQLLEVLSSMKDFKDIGTFLQNNVQYAEQQRGVEKEKATSHAVRIMRGMMERAGQNSPRYFDQLSTKTISFMGHELTKYGLVKVYQTLREKDGLDVLRENLGNKGMDFGNYRKYQQELEALNKGLADGALTSEEYDANAEVIENEYLERKEKDISKLLEILGPDGLYLADELQNLYREKGEKLRAFMAENYGQTVILDDYYTPRNIAAYNTMQEGDMESYSKGHISRTGLPSYAKHRNTPSSAALSLEINPLGEYLRYSSIMEGWMTAYELVNFNNRVWANPTTNAQLQKLLGPANYETANKDLYYFINEGRVYAQKSVLAEVMGKVFQVLAKTRIAFSLASLVRSGAAIFNPLVGSNFSSMEIIRGFAGIASGNYKGFSIEELRDLEAMKERKYRGWEDRVLAEKALSIPLKKQAQWGYWQEAGMSGLIGFDWWSISRANMLTSHMLAKRGLSHEQIRWELNKNIYQTAQPLSTSAKASHLLGGSAFEASQFLFLSDVMNKFGMVVMQGKKGDWLGAFRVYTIAAIANGLFNGLATALFGDKDKEDEFLDNLFFTAVLSPIVSVPMFGGFAEWVLSELSGKQYSLGRADVADLSSTIQNLVRSIVKTYETVSEKWDKEGALTFNDYADMVSYLGKNIGSVATVSTAFGSSGQSVTKSLEMVGALSNALSQVKTTAQKALPEPINPLYTEKEEMKERARQLKKAKREAKRENGERSATYRKLSRELRQINKLLKIRGWED